MAMMTMMVVVVVLSIGVQHSVYHMPKGAGVWFCSVGGLGFDVSANENSPLW